MSDDDVAWGTLHALVEARRWNPAIIRELALRPVVDAYGYARVRFPFRINGNVEFWQDRAVAQSRVKWLSAEGRSSVPYEIDRLSRAQDGWCWIVEGVSDVCAIVSDFPDAAVIGLPGAAACKPEHVPMFRGLRLFVIGDNDEAGEKMRARINATFAGFAREIRHGRVPGGYKDLDEWRADDPVSWPYQLLAMGQG